MATAPNAADAPCPCGSGAGYAACCGRFHDEVGADHLAAPTAEALMRSRYSAYVLGLESYLLATWHPRTRPAAIEPQPPGLRWLGLEIKRHVDAGDGTAIVEFVAKSKLGGRAHRLHETSRFERVDEAGGRWLYVDGDVR